MSLTPPPATATELPAVSDLLEQRALVQGWLARLDEHSADVHDRVAARVRGDYQQRLQQILQALATRRDAILDQCKSLSEQLATLEEELEQASDALDEARLRFRIGELPEADWTARQPELEANLDRARAERDAARAELDRLTEILGSIDGADEPEEVAPAMTTPQDAAPVTAPLATEPVTLPDWADADVTLAEPEPRAAAVQPDDATEIGHPSFLEELDRAIASSPEHAEPEEFDPEKRPPAGVKCTDCGYTNDLEAWYCGVCGADLA